MFAYKALVSAISLAAFPLARAATAGILQPPSGTAIQPGEAFDFHYSTKGDYGSSSYNFTVWLLTSEPTSFTASEDFATGHYFGRWNEENYPAIPYPENEPPAQLVMPDFSKNPGGWGSGARADNMDVYLVVLEEYATGDGVVGNRLALSYNSLVYNATHVA